MKTETKSEFLEHKFLIELNTYCLVCCVFGHFWWNISYQQWKYLWLRLRNQRAQQEFQRSFWLFQKLSEEKYGKHCIAVYCGGGQFTLMTYLPDHPVPLAVRTKWLKTWAKRAEKQNKPRNKRMFSKYRTVASPRLPWKKHYLLKIGNGAFLSVPLIGNQFNI